MKWKVDSRDKVMHTNNASFAMHHHVTCSD